MFSGFKILIVHRSLFVVFLFQEAFEIKTTTFFSDLQRTTIYEQLFLMLAIKSAKFTGFR
jgi:hypothetical protein